MKCNLNKFDTYHVYIHLFSIPGLSPILSLFVFKA